MKNIFRLYGTILVAALFCILSFSCKKPHSTAQDIPEKELILLSDIALPFNGLSGIAYSASLRKIWIVGGKHIYKLDMSGNVEKKLQFTGTDLEGIAFDTADSTLWTIDETMKEICHVDSNGNLLSQKQISYSTTNNKGPEGITIGKNHTLYILNERSPSILMKLDSLYSISITYELNFALDYSDVSYDSTSDSFFILSDETNAFFEWSERQGVVCRYTLPNTGNEGFAFDRTRNVFYIANKITDRLYIYTTK
jgi:uncharacterized protein YjiK